jgi:hypothetical protein
VDADFPAAGDGHIHSYPQEEEEAKLLDVRVFSLRF